MSGTLLDFGRPVWHVATESLARVIGFLNPRDTQLVPTVALGSEMLQRKSHPIESLAYRTSSSLRSGAPVWLVQRSTRRNLGERVITRKKYLKSNRSGFYLALMALALTVITSGRVYGQDEGTTMRGVHRLVI